MFISDTLVFVELPKTGCTHIRKLLCDVFDGQLIGKHNYPTADMFLRDSTFVGSIRNPWELYISIWSYGCDKKGGLYERVTRPHCITLSNCRTPKKLYNKIAGPHSRRKLDIRKKPLCFLTALQNEITRKPCKWKDLYTYTDDKKGFRTWLKAIHSTKRRYDFGEGYGFSAINSFAGLLTYRYTSLFCRNNHLLFSKKHIHDYKSLQAFEKSNLYITHFIRNENLEGDFIKILTACGIELSENQKQRILTSEKTNTSSRSLGVEYYYDQETAELIRQREKLIIDHFGYLPPSV